MKSAEEWAKEYSSLFGTFNSSTTSQIVKLVLSEIQLDAYKAGMSEAADIANSRHGMGSLTIAAAILTARDNKIL